MMENLDIWERARAVPDAAKKTIQAGKLKGFTDINPMWRLKCLTELFGMCGVGWYIDNVRKWTEDREGVCCAFVDLDLFVKVDGEWSKPIHGTGGNKLVSKNKNGADVSDECFKMAYTDAISVAAKALGIGADVYWEKDRTKYGALEPEQNAAQAEAAWNAEQVERGRKRLKKALVKLCGGDVDAASTAYHDLFDAGRLDTPEDVRKQLEDVDAKLKELDADAP